MSSSTSSSSRQKFGDLSDRVREEALEIRRDVSSLFDEMERRRYNVTQFKMAMTLIGFTVVLVFSQSIRRFFSQRASALTVESLNESETRDAVARLANEVTLRLLADKTVTRALDTAIRDAFAAAVIDATSNVEVRRALSVLSQETASRVLADEVIRRNAGQAARSSLYYAFVPSIFASSSTRTTSASTRD